MADIELVVLSRAIQLREISQLIAADIEPRHFFDPATRAVFNTCAEHYRIWRNSLSLEEVKRHHPDYQVVPSSDELGYLIQEFRLSRGLKFAITKVMDIHEVIARAAKGDREALVNLPDLFMEHAREVAALTPSTKTYRLSDMDQRIEMIREQQDAGAKMGVSTGIPDLDPYVGDIRTSEYFVHCGSSGRGKTQAMVRSASSAYAEGDRVLFMRLEMNAYEILEVFDSRASQLSRMALRKRELEDADYEKYADAAARVKAAKNDIIIVDNYSVGGSPTVDKVASLVEKHKADTVAVDYISLMEPNTRKSDSDWARVRDISRDLKMLATTMDVRVYAAAQSNREAMTDGPTENNIGNSISIYQDCNVMVGWHQTPDWARIDKVQGRLLKNRGGNAGPPGDSGYFEFYEHWDRDRMIFEPWTEQHNWLAANKINLPT